MAISPDLGRRAGALLHQVGKMTRGQRYAFLPFLYDEAAAAVRRANLGALQTDPT